MRVAALLTGFFLGFQSYGQLFHVADTSALIVKTVNQSPAHWYIEVFSDIAVDTALRWKATHFDNVPPEWEIGMDDQSHAYSNIQVGDSADFALPANQPFARKLIIGAELNGTPGHGICYFDVYDPYNPWFKQTISYEFVVTYTTNGLADLNKASFLEWKDGFLKVKNGERANFEVYNLSGNVIEENKLINQFEISRLPPGEVFILRVKLKNDEVILKVFN